MTKKSYVVLGGVLLFVVVLVSVFLKDGSIGNTGELSAQEVTLNTFGYPAHFMIEYLPQERAEGSAYVRHEIWYYPALEKKIAFLAGDIAYIEKLNPSTVPANPTPLKPDDFDYGIVEKELLISLGDEAVEIELIEGLAEEDGLQTYISLNAIAVLEDGALIFIQTIDPQQDAMPPEWISQSSNSSNYSLIAPRIAEARNIFRKGLRCIGKLCNFVIELPDKITRPLGPVIGPIVSAVLTKNISKHSEFGKIFRDAKRIDRVIKNVDEQKRLVGELKDIYKEQAGELRKQAQELEKEKDVLG